MTAVPLSQAKIHLAKLLAEVDELDEEVVITRSGRPVAVLLSLAEYEGLLKTLGILAVVFFPLSKLPLGLRPAKA